MNLKQGQIVRGASGAIYQILNNSDGLEPGFTRVLTLRHSSGNKVKSPYKVYALTSRLYPVSRVEALEYLLGG